MKSQSHQLIEQIVDNLIHTHPLLSKGFTRSIRTRTNLNPGSMFIVGLLKKNGMLSMSEIGNRLSMPKPHVTAHIDKLIAEGMVERQYSTRDRRIINIVLTQKGIEDFDAIKRELTLDFSERISKINEDKLEELVLSTKLVRDTLSQIMTDTTVEKENETEIDNKI